MSARLSVGFVLLSDRASLPDLWIEAWRATFPDIDFDARRDWFVAHLAKLEAAGAKILAARLDAELHGFVVVDPASGWLDQIAVRPESFGSGIARALLDAAKRISPQRLTLDVNVDNFRALKFYVREGFVQTGEGVNTLSGRKTLSLAWRR